MQAQWIHVGQMLEVALSDLKLIGTVPVVMNDAGNELISVLGPKCMQHNGCSQELGVLLQSHMACASIS